MAETEFWAECGEVSDGERGEEVKEDNSKDGGSKFEFEYRSTESPKGERRCGGIGGKPHPHTIGQVLSVVPFIGEDSFDPSRLNSIQPIDNTP